MPECDKNGLLSKLSISDENIEIVDVTVAAAKLIYSSGDFVIFACRGGFSVKGNTTSEILPHIHYKVSGKVTLYGGKPQIAASSISRIEDDDTDFVVIANFLSDSFKGVGEKTALALAKEYGKDILDVLLNKPKEAAKKVPGLSIGRALLCSNAIDEDEKHLRLMLKLRLIGLTKKQSEDAYKVFGFTAPEEIAGNPYSLLRLQGIGFETCEKIAADYNIDPLDIKRIEGAIKYALFDMHINTGSTCFTASEVRTKTESLIRGGAASGIKIDDKLVDSAFYMAVEQAVKDDVIVVARFFQGKCEGCKFDDDGALISIKSYFKDEANIKREVESFLTAPYVEPNREVAIDKINKIAGERGIIPDEKQIEALIMCMSRPFSIITGGPGTGKTTITGILAEHFKREKIAYEFCAPTGRAAKRLSEAAGVKANTIHRLLEVAMDEDEGETFCRRNRENPLQARVIVVDEASMVDTMMFRMLLWAIKSDASVILIGDPNQLPSVGAGNLLSDLLACKSIPRVELTYIFRQQDESSIASNAYRILNGQTLIANEEDFVIHNVSSDEEAMSLINELMASAMEDTAILCPTKQNTLGTVALNKRLQSKFLSDGVSSFKVREDLSLAEGDKVMQIKNNYKLEYYDSESLETKQGVFNGEIGIVEEIDFLTNSVTISFDDGKSVTYDKKNIGDVDLAYAMTVHKAQGCEFDTVVIVLGKMNYKLSSRRLLYTAVTRGKEKVVIVNYDGRLNKMIRNNVEDVRRTYLRGFMEIIDTKLMR